MCSPDLPTSERRQLVSKASFLCAALALTVPSLYAGILTTNLACGSWQNPLGIDDPNPRLSWQLLTTIPGARAQFQTACQVLVATSTDLLANDIGDLWDSGKVTSDRPNIPYSGVPLISEQQVFWKVRVWDESDQLSDWSPIESWTMGLLKPTDWQGSWLTKPVGAPAALWGCSWIWYPEGDPAVSAPAGTRYFRQVITVRGDSPLVTATLLLTADNAYVAFINGTQVGQGQDWTVATSFDVTGILTPGTNILAVAASNIGPDPTPAGLIGNLTMNYADTQQTVLQLDSSCKTDNLLQPGWNEPGFDDSSWTTALVLGPFGMDPWETGVTLPTAPGLPIFRREFIVGPGLQKAVISICGLGQYELSANGIMVGDARLAPGWSMYNQTCLYDTLDITSYLTEGTNVLGVMLGNGMYNVLASSRYYDFTGSFGPPTLLAQLHLFYTGGTDEVISTDAQWQAAPGPITFSSIYGGEDYDARLLPQGWDQAGFPAVGWSSPDLNNSGPGGVLRGTSHSAPPIKAIETLAPVQINNLSSSTIVYDLGQNASLIPSLTVDGEAGATIQITPAEITNVDGTVNRASSGGGSAYWQYTLSGNGIETWTPSFFYHGCRFLQVQLTPAPGSSHLPNVDSLQGVVIQSACSPVGDFSCSNDLFNRTRTLIRWAQRNNLVSIITDCPHRERLGWLEQANLNGPSLRYEFDLSQLSLKAMDDMTDGQTPAGLVPNFVPEYVVYSGGYRDSPEWGSSAILVPWQNYLFTGDDTLLRNYYATMTNYFNYLQGQAVNNFLRYNGLGDWYDIGPNPPGPSQDTPISLTADAYYCLDAQILAQAAAALGATDDAAHYSLLASNIAAAFNDAFYSAANGYYATGSQTAQAMPLALGIVAPENQTAVMNALVTNVRSNGLTAGEIGHRYLLRALTDQGRADVVFDLHSRTNAVGYGRMLASGATALTEAWDADPDNSQDHFMLGHFTEWLYHDLAGIRPDPAAPGFKHVLIKPAFVGDIKWVNADYNSVLGKTETSWTLSSNLATLRVCIPVGSTASVYLPILGPLTTNLSVFESGIQLWQNGQVVGGVPGVTFDHVEGNGSQTCVVWTIGSGNYDFSWNVGPILQPPSLTAQLVGNSILLRWPVNYTGWRLLAQTNNPMMGLGTNWVAVPGASVTNQLMIPIDPANGSAFFKLVYP